MPLTSVGGTLRSSGKSARLAGTRYCICLQEGLGSAPMSTTLSISGAAALHQISQKAIRHAIDTGALRAERLVGPNGQYLLRSEDVDAWIAKRAVAPGSSGYFAAMARLDALPTLIQQHHAITADLPIADVVIACRCSPDTERDTLAWALHLRDVMSGATETSGALAS